MLYKALYFIFILAIADTIYAKTDKIIISTSTLGKYAIKNIYTKNNPYKTNNKGFKVLYDNKLTASCLFIVFILYLSAIALYEYAIGFVSTSFLIIILSFNINMQFSDELSSSIASFIFSSSFNVIIIIFVFNFSSSITVFSSICFDTTFNLLSAKSIVSIFSSIYSLILLHAPYTLYVIIPDTINENIKTNIAIYPIVLIIFSNAKS